MSAIINEAAERYVLGAFLQSEDAAKKLLPTMGPDDFAVPKNREIFMAMQGLRGRPIDVGTVLDELGRRKSAVQMPELTQIFREVPSTVNVQTYYDLVKESAARRALEALGRKLQGDANNGMLDMVDILDASRQTLRNMAGGRGKWMSAGELAGRTSDYLEAACKGELRCVKSGLPDLDWMIGGFYPGELTIVGARPAVGKSAFALSILLHAAKKGVRAALVSREMSPEQIGARMVSNQGGIHGSKLRKGKIDPDDWVVVSDALGILSEMPFHTSYSIRTIEDLWLEAQNLYDTQGLGLLIVDYLQLMRTNRRATGRVEEVEAVSGALKDIALDLNIPVIALAQVRRNGTRAAMMPVMDELKGSGAIEQDADGIILMHRPEALSDPSIAPEDVATFQALGAAGSQGVVLNVVKQRQGDTGAFGVAFDPQHMTYTCIQH